MKNIKKLLVTTIISLLVISENTYAATCPLGKDVTQDLANLLKIIQIVGPILVFVVTVLEVIKTVSKGDIEGETKKLGQRLLKRIIYCLLLFFVPVLVKTAASIAQIDVASCDISNPTDNNYSEQKTESSSKATESTTSTTSIDACGDYTDQTSCTNAGVVGGAICTWTNNSCIGTAP